MAKKKAMVETATGPAPAPKSVADAEKRKWELEDDTRTINNYLDLRQDKGRHSRAISNIRKRATRVEGLTGSRKPSRGGGRA